MTDRAGQTLSGGYAESGRRTSMSPVVVLVRNIVSTVQIWRTRAQARRELASRSDRELRDMGTCWASIADEVSKPFWRA